jgi:hypothetical protein
MTKYAELRLRIDRGVGRGSYRIVATGPAGEALGRFKLPFSELELENFILKVGATRRGRRRIDSPEMELAKNFGTKLFGALFEGDVRELYRSSFSETRSSGQGLRVTLSLTGAPELLQVPWEYMYDHPSFLSISTWTPIVRYLDLPKPRRPLQVALPIRILAMVSSPNDAEVIDAPQERAKLEAALKPLIEAGAIAIDWLAEASLRALQRQLRRGDYHVFHFIGHGGYDQDADDGVLLFEDEVGRGRRVSGIQLGTILADEVSLRLAVLNSCEGARSSLQDPFSGVATSLIEREIPAVIGMQFEITDRAAIVFAGEFYSALADGLPVDSSVAEARKAIYADQNDIEWGTPVLFMRVADGRLFDVQSHAPIRAEGGSPAAAAAAIGAAEVPAEAIIDGAASRERERAEEEDRLARAEAEAVEREREAAEALAAAEQLEKERREEERVAREAAERAERERAAAEAERLEAERLEQDRLAREAAERAERERAAAEAQRLEAERLEQERLAREAADAAEREEQARLAREAAEAAERDRAAAEATKRAEQTRSDQEANRAAAERENAAQERTAALAAGIASAPPPQSVAVEPQSNAAEASSALPGAALATAAGAVAAPSTATADAAADASRSAGGVPAARRVASEGQFRLGRTAARAALGSLVGLVMSWVWLANATTYFDGSSPDDVLNEVALTLLAVTTAVALVEGRWPALRIPGGRTYRFVGGNRWVASAIEGSIVGGLVGWLTAVAFWLQQSDDKAVKPELFLLYAVSTGLGFVIAEAVIHAFRPAGAAPSRDLSGASTPTVVEGGAADGPDPSSRDASAARFSLARAGARAALGGLVGVAMAWLLARIVAGSDFEGVAGGTLVGNFLGEAVWTMITITSAVLFVEFLWPALRVPSGTAYRSVGGNRWAATAIEGLIAGGSVGWLTSLAFWEFTPGGPSQFYWESIMWHSLLTGLGFLIAEAVIHAFRGRPSAS